MRTKDDIIAMWMAELDARRATIELSRGGTELKISPFSGTPFVIRKVQGSVQGTRRLL